MIVSVNRDRLPSFVDGSLRPPGQQPVLDHGPEPLGDWRHVNGAAPAHDSALVTASAEMKWLNGFALAGTFEGEFSNVTNSYAGKAWCGMRGEGQGLKRSFSATACEIPHLGKPNLR
jgi:hypothetical protein